jgi:hypothetical protein
VIGSCQLPGCSTLAPFFWRKDWKQRSSCERTASDWPHRRWLPAAGLELVFLFDGGGGQALHGSGDLLGYLGENLGVVVVGGGYIDVLSVCLHSFSAVCAQASGKPIRVDLRAEGSLFLRRRMGYGRTREPHLIAEAS